jgi:hypothetical protein
MSDHDTAAAILADMTGLPATDPAIQRDAERMAPRLARIDPSQWKAEIVAGWQDLARLTESRIATITTQEAA